MLNEANKKNKRQNGNNDKTTKKDNMYNNYIKQKYGHVAVKPIVVRKLH